MSNKLVRYSFFALLAILAFAAGVWLNPAREGEPSAPDAAAALYAMRLPDLQNQPQKLEQWRGKVLVINFWATWCEPCRKEIPLFVRAQEKYAAEGLQFVGISIDQADKTREFARNFSINYPNLIGTFDAVETSRLAGNQQRVLPYTIVLDRKGQIVATEPGGITQEKLYALIKPLL